METTNPSGFFGTLSSWISAFGEFAYNNIGLTLLVLWCFTLFAMTEFAKPIIRRFLKEKEDSQLVVKLFPQVMGSVTGYQVFPLIVSTTKWGGTWAIPGGVGIGAGFLFGLVTIALYDLSRSKKFVTFTKTMIKKLMYKIPGLSQEEVDRIMATTQGVDTADLNELQGLIEGLKAFGDVDMEFADAGTISITVKLKDEKATSDEKPENAV